MSKRNEGRCAVTAELPLDYQISAKQLEIASGVSLTSQLESFNLFHRQTSVSLMAVSDGPGGRATVPVYTNEFWTARQRQASSLHEISYRACFKPQLPRFFIERLSKAGDRVYDPFMGRGTTLVEAALLGRIPLGNDINPLSHTMVRPRLRPASLQEIADRLKSIPMDQPGEMPEDLMVFYHPETLKAISSLRRYLLEKRADGIDHIDEWIAMVALNRLTGHSAGFFSVYTLPPNQAVSVASQRKINERRKQAPQPKNVAALILKKSKQLLSGITATDLALLHRVAEQAQLENADAAQTSGIASNSVALVVTSPPFLDVVQYAADNWLRCWFLGIDAKSVKLTLPKKVAAWTDFMSRVLRELHRIVRPGGHIAFEVGEVDKGTLGLEQIIVPAGHFAGLEPLLVLINDQHFTKTANCWGVDNMTKGTNSNRVVVFRKKA